MLETAWSDLRKDRANRYAEDDLANLLAHEITAEVDKEVLNTVRNLFNNTAT